MEQNKTGKYLKYAIGEIILVVIGILIALSINNWNENRQKKNLEQDYLSEIKGNLIKDTLNINKTIAYNTKKTDSIVSTLALFEKGKQGKPYFDELRPKIAVLTDFKIFTPVRTGFDNMVTSEKIGLIRNKELRTKLSNYYSDLSYEHGTQERTKQITREFTDDIIPKLLTNELINDFIGLDLDLKSEHNIRIHANETVISNLFVMLQNSSVLIEELTQRNIAIKGVIGQIETELK